MFYPEGNQYGLAEGKVSIILICLVGAFFLFWFWTLFECMTSTELTKSERKSLKKLILVPPFVGVVLYYVVIRQKKKTK